MLITTPRLVMITIFAVLVGGAMFLLSSNNDSADNNPVFSLSTSGAIPQGLTTPTVRGNRQQNSNARIRPNLTSDIGRSLATIFLNENPEFAEDLFSNTESVEATIQSPLFVGGLINEVQKALQSNPDLFNEHVYRDDFTTTSDNSLRSQKEYLTTLDTRVIQLFSNARNPIEVMSTFLAQKNEEEINKEIDRIQTALAVMSEIPVPPTWLEFHIIAIAKLKEEKQVFIAIKRIDDDPTTALAAVAHQQQLLFDFGRLNKQANDALTALQ